MKTYVNRDQLNQLTPQIIQRGSYASPEISVYLTNGNKWAVKDCSGMQPFLKLIIGRRYKNREISIYKRLEGVEGIPSFKGIIDQDAFAVEFIEGETLSRKLAPELLNKALDNLEKVINTIHERGVVHLDLKQKRNVLVKASGEVVVIDFQSSLFFSQSPLGRLMISLLKGRDKAGLVKFKAKYAPAILTPEEKRKYKRDLILSQLWPFSHLGRLVRQIFKN
jgi:serine/threonine protein kinase